MITEGDCAICCERLSSNPLAVTVPCGHVFHRDCIAKWDATSKDRITDCTGAGRTKCAICGNFTDCFIDLYIDLEKDGGNGEDDEGDDISLSSCESCGCCNSKKMESSSNVVDILSQRPNDLEFILNNNNSNNDNNNNDDNMLCIEEKHLDLVALRHSAIASQLNLDASMEKMNKKAKAKKAALQASQQKQHATNITNDKNILQNNNISPPEKLIALHKQTRQLKRKIRKLQSSNSKKQRTIIEQQHTQSMLITIKKQYLQAKQKYEQAKTTEKRYCMELAEARLESAAAVRQLKQIESQLQSLRNDQLQLLAKREQAYIEMSHLKRQHKAELEKAHSCGIEEVKELRRDHPKLIQENADLRKLVLDKERMIERLKTVARLNGGTTYSKKAGGMKSTGVDSYSSSDDNDDEEDEMENTKKYHASTIRKKWGAAATSSTATSSAAAATAATSFSLAPKKRPASSSAALPQSSYSRPQNNSGLNALSIASKAYKSAKMAQQRRTLLHESGNFTPSLGGRTLQGRKPSATVTTSYAAPAPPPAASCGSLFSDEHIQRGNSNSTASSSSSVFVDLCGGGAAAAAAGESNNNVNNDRSTENEIIDLLGGDTSNSSDNSGGSDDNEEEEEGASSAAAAAALARPFEHSGNTGAPRNPFHSLGGQNDNEQETNTNMLPMMSITIPTSINSQQMQNKRRKYGLPPNFESQENEQDIAPSFNLFASSASAVAAPTPAAAMGIGMASSMMGGGAARDSLGSQASDGSSFMASAVAASADIGGGGGDLGGIMRYCAKPPDHTQFSLSNNYFGNNMNGNASNNNTTSSGDAYASLSSSSNNAANMMQNNSGRRGSNNNSSMYSSNLMSEGRKNDIRNFFAS